MNDRFMAKLMDWRHTSGFSVYNGLRIAPDDVDGQEALAQYIIRSPFSTVKMTYNEQMGTVIYRSKMTYGRNRRNFELFSAVDFIAAITQHIPEKNFQLVRYYGWYSNRMRGDRRKREQAGQAEEIVALVEGIEIIDVAD